MISRSSSARCEWGTPSARLAGERRSIPIHEVTACSREGLVIYFHAVEDELFARSVTRM